MSAKPTLVSALRGAVRGQVASVETALPGVVTGYDRAAQTCSVEVAVPIGRQEADGTVSRTPAPPLSGVPVVFPGGVAFDLSAGDTVLLVFASRSIDEWRSTGAVGAAPLDGRRHDLTDAIAIPGLRHGGAAIGSTGYAAGAWVLEQPDIRLGSSAAASAVVLAPLLTGLDGVLDALADWADDIGGDPVKLAALTAAIGVVRGAIAGGGYVAGKVKAE